MGREPGFGWDYPPGTPGPTSETVLVSCSECDHEQVVTYWADLGTGGYDPEECPVCGGPWDDEQVEPYTRDDYLADNEDRYRDGGDR